MRLGLFVGEIGPGSSETGNWTFIKEIYDDWKTRYEIDIYKSKKSNPPYFGVDFSGEHIEKAFAPYCAGMMFVSLNGPAIYW